MKKVLIVIANSGFQDIEFGTPKKILEDADVETDIAAGQRGACAGKFGTEVQAKYALTDLSGNAYDAVFFVGGPGCAPQYIGNSDYFRLAQEAKILAAICIAPTVLSDSGIFQGKRVTGWNRNDEQKEHIEKNGGIFVDENVVRDGHILTGNGPEAAEEFGKELVRMLQE